MGKKDDAKPGTKKARLEAYAKAKAAFTWDIDEAADEFVALAAGEEYRFPLNFSFEELLTFRDADDEMAALVEFLEGNAASAATIARLKSGPYIRMVAILDAYGETVAEVQKLALGE